jgi:hypothetical protein
MRKFLGRVLWLVSVVSGGVLLEFATSGPTPYPVDCTVTVRVAGPEGKPLADVDLAAGQLALVSSRDASVLRTETLATATTGAEGTAVLAFRAPGMTSAGVILRVRRWFGEDGPSRKASIRSVLESVSIRVESPGWRHEPRALDLADVENRASLLGDSWFRHRERDLQLAVRLDVVPDASQRR